jgi:hypothetical protein
VSVVMSFFISIPSMGCVFAVSFLHLHYRGRKKAEFITAPLKKNRNSER